MSDSGRVLGDCEHGNAPYGCPWCLRQQIEKLEAKNMALQIAYAALQEEAELQEEAAQAILGLRAGLVAVGVSKPGGRCWCAGWASMPCIGQPQCKAARDLLARGEGGAT